MKKTAIILAAVLAACAVCFTACTEKGKDEITGNDNLNENTDIGVNVDETATMSFDEALEKLATIETKGELDNETLLTVEGVPMSAAATRYANLASRQYGSGDEETILKEIDEFYRLNSAIVLLAREFNLRIPEADFEQNLTSQISTLRSMYGEQYETIVYTYTLQSPYFYAENILLNMGFEKLLDYYYGENGVSEDKQQIFDESLVQLKENDYIQAKHILIAFPEDAEKDEEGNVTEAAKAETLAKANEVLEKVKAGEDFDALIAEYGEDPGMEAQPEGYLFTKGAMVPEFEEAAYALEIGETSDLVETTYGYHIILKLDVNNKSVYTSEPYLNSAYAALREELVEYSSDYTVEYAENYEARVDEFIAEYEAEMQAQAQAQADYEAAQQAQTEAEAAE